MGFRLIIILKTKPHFNEIIMKQNWFRELETQKWLKWARFIFFTKKIKNSRYRLVQKCWNSDYWLISELRLIPTIKFWFRIPLKKTSYLFDPKIRFWEHPSINFGSSTKTFWNFDFLGKKNWKLASSYFFSLF